MLNQVSPKYFWLDGNPMSSTAASHITQNHGSSPWSAPLLRSAFYLDWTCPGYSSSLIGFCFPSHLLRWLLSSELFPVSWKAHFYPVIPCYHGELRGHILSRRELLSPTGMNFFFRVEVVVSILTTLPRHILSMQHVGSASGSRCLHVWEEPLLIPRSTNQFNFSCGYFELLPFPNSKHWNWVIPNNYWELVVCRALCRRLNISELI